MKNGTNVKGWPMKPWTVVASHIKGERGLATRYYARNLTTGEEKPMRKSYNEALADIPPGQQAEGLYAEPWGV